MSENLPVVVHPAGLPDVSPARRLLDAFLAGRSAATLRSYKGDICDFARYVGAATPDEAAAKLLGGGPGAANETALHYKGDLLARGLAAATVNRRLAALRSLVKLGRTLGVVNWSLEVEGLRSEGYKDMRGPGHEGFRRLLEQLAGRTDRKSVRDRAIVRLLYDLALRRKEVVGIDVADLDLAARTVAVVGKGRREKQRLKLPQPTAEALAAWLAVRPSPAEGPLFIGLAANKPGCRLNGGSVYRIVQSLGGRAGFRCRPHGLRHASITRVLDMNGGNIRAAQKFSRHADVRVLQLYDDSRESLGAQMADLVANDAA